MSRNRLSLVFHGPRGLFPIMLALALVLGATRVPAATLSPALQEQLATISDATPLGQLAIVAFFKNPGQTIGEGELAVLAATGVTKGFVLPNLGMVAVPATAGQVRLLAQRPEVRSIWLNERLSYFNYESRVLCGVEKVRTDPQFTAAAGGLPVAGQGNFSVVVNDSGIDATHADLHFPEHVIQNVFIVTDTDTLSGFTPLLYQENIPDTDVNVGHGTHVAGIVGGTGARSGSLYAGVAPGAKIIGTGSGAVLFILNALGGFEWSLANQFQYNIRIITNSWGSNGPFHPDHPINIASKEAHDRNIVVLFAAGNSGPGKNTMNPYAKAPWVIAVAAGTKEGGLAAFSSRGTPKEERLGNDDPFDDFDAPTIVAPGTGREFETNAGKFTAAVISTRSATNLFSNGLTDDLEIPPAYVPFYTQISGTSMATPFAAGVVALMLTLDPTLTPDQVKAILQETASRMPGYQDYEVGAGYINAYAAVDKVLHRSKPYRSFQEPSFNARFTVSGPPPQPFHIDYNPAALPGPGSPNSLTFTVPEGMSELDVFAVIDNAIQTGDGNTVGLLLTDPNGAQYSSGIMLPILDAPTRQVVVKNPAPGSWLLEVRGIRGLAAVPNFRLPTSGAALPGPVDGTITMRKFTLEPVPDIQGHPVQAEIEFVLKNRMMDTFADGTFRPDSNVTRGDFAYHLALNTALRQSLANTPRFTDVSGQLLAIAEAVTANGSTLRDWNFVPKGMMSAQAPYFRPNDPITRIEVAVALVRALGLDAEARAKAGQNVTVTYGGQTLVLTDNGDIPSELRGYVQLALDKQILQAFFSLEQGPFDFFPTLKARFKPNDPLTRAFLAFSLRNYRQHFVSGN